MIAGIVIIAVVGLISLEFGPGALLDRIENEYCAAARWLRTCSVFAWSTRAANRRLHWWRTRDH